MAEPATFFGWTEATWRKAFVWAGTPMPAFVAENAEDYRRVRIKWLNAGGPPDGPTSFIGNWPGMRTTNHVSYGQGTVSLNGG